jgi:hypothetical protein
MPTCIYCRHDQREQFSREHVIPRSLGSFQDNLTIGSVCLGCNQYFGKHLDLQLARESAESVVRMQYGLGKRDAAPRKSTVIARINVPGPMFGAKVLLGPNAAGDGIEITYLPQVALQGKDSEDWKWYLEEDLTPEMLQTPPKGIGIIYFVTSEKQLARLRSRLREFGLPATKVVKRDRVLPGTPLTARVTVQFYSNLARCVAKIAFNYLAYATGENTACLLREEFDAIRSFVRQGENPGAGFVYFSSSPRFDPEDRKGSFVDILAVGWDPANQNIFCNVSLFNAMVYRITLSRGYSGVWFPLGSAHSFDCQSRVAERIPFGIRR